ncbi:kinase-like protein [Cylindrobasidium torrendii FP15055 ss-10]|uniref:Kinase-like protein n=1 Tax=Cylindrobasidium torrendii FP15055 ss-10 TaxID=1314674 RepID=A0A0D7AWK5_9AGAR|nr:kinase-like protein [Cylindrobasidium torrendii FP15055 ss-10]
MRIRKFQTAPGVIQRQAFQETPLPHLAGINDGEHNDFWGRLVSIPREASTPQACTPCIFPDPRRQFDREGYIPTDGQSQEICLKKKEVTVGRWDLDAMVCSATHPVVDDKTISQIHFRIIKEDDVVKIQDTSMNGTWHNEQRIGRLCWRCLKHGDTISFGPQLRYHYRYEYTSPASASLCRYTALRRIGCGAFATVYEGLRKSDHARVAIKHVQRVTLKGENYRFFLAELEVMQRVSGEHENIVTLMDRYCFDGDGLAGNGLRLVQEYMPGGALQDWLDDPTKKWSEPLVQHFTLHLMGALAYLHKQNIVHRDIKPDNLLLTLHNPPVLKLADFGMSKLASAGAAFGTFNIGCAPYAAPEQGIEGGSYTVAVDNWAAGVVVYNLVTREQYRESQSRGCSEERLGRTGLSQNGVLFTTALICQPVASRLTAQNALSHPWMLDHIPVYAFDKKTREPVELWPLAVAKNLKWNGETDTWASGPNQLPTTGI